MKRDADAGSTLPDCSGKRFAILAARFYGDLADAMIADARRALRDCGVADDGIDAVSVPGCFELPLACRNAWQTRRYDGLVALGVVVRGETPHFDYVAGECARGIMDVQLSYGAPIGFGVLTTETLEQARERVDGRRGRKGYDAAIAAAAMAVLL